MSAIEPQPRLVVAPVGKSFYAPAKLCVVLLATAGRTTHTRGKIYFGEDDKIESVSCPLGGLLEDY